ncbi:hypothetical protein SAMN05421595_1376 [Austwickia chelonae]|uniref:Uncharacterized protein n=1 Tax=Austwickia chelonae NBRC 105200 TaxID=1184607 RepID=K6VLF7_9MICO|nr:hypothetical protein [Austwickia chelonae]GAB77539.1 hypothetical protein AUCHE_05_04510 [Austwickia chelonae NBRC 105200]SEW12454.1 hypothetical protein SAMN05421595_1376 [Austwickia chelonae]
MTLLTTAQAAELVGVKPTSLRGLVSRLRKAGIELQAPKSAWPDLRTPMYDEGALREWMDSRPGRGNWTSGEDRKGGRA